MITLFAKSMKTLAFLSITCLPMLGQTAASLSPNPNLQFFNTSTGVSLPCVGCSLYTYTAGTTTPLATYVDYTGTSTNADPIVLDSNGYTPSGIWIKGSCYKFVLQDASAVTIWTQDQICDNAQLFKAALAASGGAALVGFLPTNGTVATTVAAALNDAFLLDIGYTTFAAACSAAVGASKTLAVTKAWTALGTQSCTASLIFFKGGTLQVSNTRTVTIPGNTDCPLTQQCYDESLGGKIAFSSVPPAISPMQWGADNTGVSDVHSAAASAIRAAGAVAATAPYGATVFWPCGQYLLASTLVIPSTNGLLFHGSGGCTRFTWSGNNSTPMFRVDDNNKSEYAHFRIDGNATFPLLYGIQQRNSGSGASRWTSITNRYIDIVIEGNAGYITTGMYFGGGTNGNNDQMYIESVNSLNYAHSGFTLDNTQIYDVTFNHCQAVADGWGNYGLEVINGNAYWLYGDMAGNVTSDFYYGATNSSLNLIQGGRYESSAAFITTGGPAGNPLQLHLSGVSFAGNFLGCSQAQIKAGSCASPPGGAAITYKFPGPLTIDGGSYIGQEAGVALTIKVSDIENPTQNYFSVVDTFFTSSVATQALLFATAGGTILPTHMANSTLTADGTTFIPLSNRLQTLTIQEYPLASQPACTSGTRGTLAMINDTNTVTWGATITGGSAGTYALGFCDGTNWTVMGK